MPTTEGVRPLYGSVAIPGNAGPEPDTAPLQTSVGGFSLKIAYLFIVLGVVSLSGLVGLCVNKFRSPAALGLNVQSKTVASLTNHTKSHTHKLRQRQLNIILILADDLDLVLDGMLTANNILSEIRDKGTSLEYFFANNPECCPSRATLLTGRYTHNQRAPIINNTVEGNCGSMQWANSDGQYTIGRKMEGLGYSTAYVGKFLNAYGDGYGNDRGTPIWDGNHAAMPLEMIPPGWGNWFVRKGSSNYYWNYSMSVNGVATKFEVSSAIPEAGTADADKYSQTVYQNYTLTWMEEKLMAQNLTAGTNYSTGYATTPFFLLTSPSAPHATFDAAPDDYTVDLTDVKAPRTPNFYTRPNNTVGDWVTGGMFGGDDQWAEDYTDWVHQRRLTTMLSLDRYVESMMELVVKYDKMDETVWIFTSDNGHHLGQFGYSYEKAKPWETDIRLPFYIRGPDFHEGKVIEGSSGFGAMVDIFPTLYELGGGNNNQLESAGNIDGRSLVDLLRGNGGYGLSTDTLVRMDISPQKKHQGCKSNHDGSDIPTTVSFTKCEWFDLPPKPKGTFNENRTFCFGINAWNTTYDCIRTIWTDTLANISNNTMYCEYPDSTESLVAGFPRNELFDLSTDPWQMVNLVRRIDTATLQNYSDRLADKMTCKGSDSCTAHADYSYSYSYTFLDDDS